MAREFDGKVALVTGASSGIGSAVARMLASRGADLVLMDISDGNAQAQSLAGEFDVRTLAISVNMVDTMELEEAFSKAMNWAKQLDICVNAAGIFPPGKTIDSTTSSMWEKVISVNLSGIFYCMKEELGIFLRLGRGGSIVNISSDAGSVASAGCAAYVASKHGINGLTKTAALEYAKRGIRVNAVAPGNIDTPMMHQFGDTAKIVRETQPTGRCGQPEEVAELVCFLSSERCTFMTGSIVAVDGGITTTGYSGEASSVVLFNRNLSQRENSTDFKAKVLAHTFFQCISDFDTSDSCFIT